MADLDPALVEKVARAICLEDGQDPDAMDAAIVCDIDSNPLPTWQAYEDKSRAALLSLPIPAAALNALARDEATVVPKKPDVEQESAGGAAIDHPSVFMGGPSHRGRRLARNTYEAMLAASPYTAKE